MSYHTKSTKSAEATALGLPLGNLPDSIDFEQMTYRAQQGVKGRNGELLYVLYVSPSKSHELRIFNV